MEKQMTLEIQGMAPLLSVFDMPASLAFYRDLFGFRVVQDSGRGDNSDWVLLERSGVQVMLNTQYEADSRPPVPDSEAVKWHHDTCLYFGCPDVDAAYKYLRESGSDLRPPRSRIRNETTLFARS